MHLRTAREIVDAWFDACESHPDQRPGQVLANAVGDCYYKSVNEILEDLLAYARKEY